MALQGARQLAGGATKGQKEPQAAKTTRQPSRVAGEGHTPQQDTVRARENTRETRTQRDIEGHRTGVE